MKKINDRDYTHYSDYYERKKMYIIVDDPRYLPGRSIFERGATPYP